MFCPLVQIPIRMTIALSFLRMTETRHGRDAMPAYLAKQMAKEMKWHNGLNWLEALRLSDSREFFLMRKLLKSAEAQLADKDPGMPKDGQGSARDKRIGGSEREQTSLEGVRKNTVDESESNQG